MPLVRQPIPALYGGVSQQSPALRSPTQCEEAVNCDFSIAKGVSKRPPSEIIAQTGYRGSWQFHHWMRGPDGKLYVIVIGDSTPSNIDVFRVEDGAAITVTGGVSSSYLTATQPRDAYRAVTVNNDTYIVNTETTVEMTSATVAGSVAGTYQTLEDIPASPTEGNIYKILGDLNNNFDTYFVKVVSGKFVEWVEPGIEEELDPATMPHVLNIELDEVDPDGIVITFGQATWDKRLVGDDESNKKPSFVDQTISGIFFHANRLGFLSENKVSISETDHHKNFWRTTVTDVLDTDRIDATVQNSGKLAWAKPLGKSVILVGEHRNFSMDGSPFSPRTVSITQATEYPASTTCEPVSAGPNFYFTAPSGEHTQVREMFVQEDVVLTEAADITSHVPSYVDGNAWMMASNPLLDYVFVLPDPNGNGQGHNELFVYKYYYSGDEKVLSAWAKWTFPEAIFSIHCDEHYLYFFTRGNSDSVAGYLARINLKQGDVGNGNSFSYNLPVYLDFSEKVTGVYDGVDNVTRFVTAYPFNPATGFSDDLRLVLWNLKVSDKNGPHIFAPLTSGSKHGFQITGDYDNAEVWIGFVYTMEYTFSEQFLRDSNVSTLNARVQLRNMTVSFQDTGYFETEVKVKGSDENLEEFVPALTDTYTSRTVGDEHFQLNTPQLATGSHRFPVLGKSSDVTVKIRSGSYTPCHIQNAEWEALVTTRTRR